jgi:hypothetical protein
MTDAVVTYAPWLLSAITIWFNLMAGNKHRWAWAIALVGQAGWLTWIILSANWGFLPMNIALWIVYTRNHMKWQAEPEPTQ